MKVELNIAAYLSLKPHGIIKYRRKQSSSRDSYRCPENMELYLMFVFMALFPAETVRQWADRWFANVVFWGPKPGVAKHLAHNHSCDLEVTLSTKMFGSSQVQIKYS